MTLERYLVECIVKEMQVTPAKARRSIRIWAKARGIDLSRELKEPQL